MLFCTSYMAIMSSSICQTERGAYRASSLLIPDSSALVKNRIFLTDGASHKIMKKMTFWEFNMEKQRVADMREADLKGKVVLVRMDHNVVKKGKIKDSMRIDATIPTLLHLYKMGAYPILMTHVGRPYDKKTGLFTISSGDAVEPIVSYLNQILSLNGKAVELPYDANGIVEYAPIGEAVKLLKGGELDYLYLPNTRWFNGEEAVGARADEMSKAICQYADVYINDAFGSWQAHASTVGFTKYLPSYSGLLMQKEIDHLQSIFNPQRPLVSVVAGSKFDTKIGPLSALIRISDYLILGGVIYNAYLCVKYGVKIKGVGDDDLEMARKFIQDTHDVASRIVELPYIVESDSIEDRQEGAYRTVAVSSLKAGMELSYVLDADPQALQDERIKKVFGDAKTIFINAVMGYTSLFGEGSAATYKLLVENKDALKLFGGGDTIQDFKDLLPSAYAKASQDPTYYFFTGGGAILNAIENGSAYDMKPIQALLK